MRTLKLLLTDAFRFCVPPRAFDAHKSVSWIYLLQSVYFPGSEKNGWCVRKLRIMRVLTNTMGIARAWVPNLLTQPTGLLTSTVPLI